MRLAVSKPKARQKARKPLHTSRQRIAKAQGERNPMLGVRVPRALYTQLQQAATQDQRTLADWLRLSLPRWLRQDAVWASNNASDVFGVSQGEGG